LEALFYIVLPPPAARVSPLCCDNHQKVDENPEKQGIKGMLPACCLPLWGREGVTLLTSVREYANNGKMRISTEPKKRNF